MFRRLLIALLLACPAIVMTQMAAHAACSCKAGTYQQSVDRADVVFSGVLTRQSTGRTGADGSKETTYQVQAERVYKGNVSTADVDVVSPRDDCTLGTLEADQRYMFFVTESGSEFMTDRCSGTGPADDEMVSRVERLLGPGQDVTAPPPAEPEAAEFTKVANAEPETLSRLVAPGAALVIVGLLGLLLVGRLSRRETPAS